MLQILRQPDTFSTFKYKFSFYYTFVEEIKKHTCITINKSIYRQMFCLLETEIVSVVGVECKTHYNLTHNNICTLIHQ